jgi:hypothetical protein
MPSVPIPGDRRSRRITTKQRASLVLNLRGVQKMSPFLIVDRSQERFRLRGNFRLRRGQLVELVLDDLVDSMRCEVIWTGKAGSEVVEVGLQTVGK